MDWSQTSRHISSRSSALQPAHTSYPTTLSRLADVPGTRLGGPEGSNDRMIHKHIHADGVPSCQFVLGVTVLEPAIPSLR